MFAYEVYLKMDARLWKFQAKNHIVDNPENLEIISGWCELHESVN